ncbi:MAG: hypothetical protein E6I84_14465, partial [Chloroflexi bacterium]
MAPVAPPTIPTHPLGPVPPPPLALPAVGTSAGNALHRSDSTSLQVSPSSTALSATAPPPGCTNWTKNMQVLVISTDGTEADLGAIQAALGFHTIQYTTWIATQKPGQLTSSVLTSSACAGKFHGVILTTGSLSYSPDGGTTWQSALSTAEWQALRTYEANFHVREISWYVYPGADQGLNPPWRASDTTNSPINATLTAAGQTVFNTVNAANPIPITKAWAYQATASDPNVTPLLVDSSNDALVSSRVTADGRETLAMTFDSNQYLVHDLVLQHGLIHWVTRGVYLGEYRAYLQPQVDDLFIDDDMYNASAYPGGVYRITPNDYNKSHSWWAGQVSKPGNADFRVLMAFNGQGSDDIGPNDPLTLAVKNSWSDYFWCSHTYTHLNLDFGDDPAGPPVGYDAAYAEFDNNNQFAVRLGIPDYSTQCLVNPDVSGLTNPAVLQAAVDNGIQFMISDTSKESGKGNPGWNNPAPNIGIYSDIQPSILFTPRHPTNLFYNVSYPDEWLAHLSGDPRQGERQPRHVHVARGPRRADVPPAESARVRRHPLALRRPPRHGDCQVPQVLDITDRELPPGRHRVAYGRHDGPQLVRSDGNGQQRRQREVHEPERSVVPRQWGLLLDCECQVPSPSRELRRAMHLVSVPASERLVHDRVAVRRVMLAATAPLNEVARALRPLAPESAA